MKPGTKVYWYHLNEEKYWAWKSKLNPYTLEPEGKPPEPEKYSGVLVTSPELTKRANRDSWVCLVARDSDGKIVEMETTKLYVFMAPLPL